MNPLDSANPFDTIEEIPWGQLEHAYGPATDVPDLLLALMWPDRVSGALAANAKEANKPVFDYVCWALLGNVYHQGTVWQVTATTVPFFIEILESGPNDVALQTFVISYLHHLAIGMPEAFASTVLDPDIEFRDVDGLIDSGAPPDYSSSSTTQRQLIWRRDCYEAVEHKTSVILPFVRHDDANLAAAAIALCHDFPRQFNTFVADLCQVARGGTPPRVLSPTPPPALSSTPPQALGSLSLAVHGHPDALKLARQHVMSNDGFVRVVGACAVVLANPSEVEPEIVHLLRQPLGELGDRPLVLGLSSVSELVARCLEAAHSNT